MRNKIRGGTENEELSRYNFNSNTNHRRSRCYCLIDLQVFIEIECENKKKPNKALYNTDATYTKIWDKRNFERIKQNFEHKYA